MEDKKQPPAEQPDNAKQSNPPQEPAQEKGTNDPDFPSQDSEVQKGHQEDSSREPHADLKISQSTLEIYDIENQIDPGNEHHHSENSERFNDDIDEMAIVEEDSDYQPPY